MLLTVSICICKLIDNTVEVTTIYNRHFLVDNAIHNLLTKVFLVGKVSHFVETSIKKILSFDNNEARFMVIKNEQFGYFFNLKKF